jgi:hypothetical protein
MPLHIDDLAALNPDALLADGLRIIIDIAIFVLRVFAAGMAD